MTTKKQIIVCALWFLAGITAMGATYSIYRYYHPKKESGVSTQNMDWYYQYEDAREKINIANNHAASLEDSLFHYKVAYGHLGIELNQSKAELQRYSNGYRKAKPVRDTAQMLSNCDSLIDALDQRYIRENVIREQVADSINSFYIGIIDFKDTAIKDCTMQLDTIATRLFNCGQERMDQDKKIKRLEQKKKGAIRLAWIGTGIAAIGILINSLFN
jgi:hypothetical protein